MNITTSITGWLNEHPRTKQWVWFVTLWLGGIVALTAVTYPLKLLIHAH